MPKEPDPLQSDLDNAEAELRRRLKEACVAESKGVSTESTQEIRRLEDALLAAAVAAGQTIKVRRQMKAVRRQMKARPPVESEGRIAGNEAASRKKKADFPAEKNVDDSAVDDPSEKPDTRVREFTDQAGRAWRAWPVIPGLTRTSASGRSFLGDFQNGWICFEGMDCTARRRLPRRQASWASVTDDELQRLLAQAIDAPGLETRRKDKS